MPLKIYRNVASQFSDHYNMNIKLVTTILIFTLN
jgi:hypothetical protein